MQEVDCIIEQMMSVARYLDWDTVELEPVEFKCDYCMASYLYSSFAT